MTRILIGGLLPPQQEAMELSQRDDVLGILINGGSASGKTLLAWLLMRDAINNGARTIAYLAPTNDQLYRIWMTYFGTDGTPVEAGTGIKWGRALLPGSWNQNRGMYVTTEGATIWQYTAENKAVDRFQSIHPDRIFCDEIGSFSDYAINLAMERRGTRPGSKLIGVSTPYRAAGRYFDMVNNPPPGFHVVRCPSRMNPHRYTEERLDELRATMPDWLYRLKFEGEFTRASGLVFDVPSVQRVDGLRPDYYPTTYVAGLDWGYTHAAAFVLCSQNRDGHPAVLAEWYDHGRTLDEIVDGVRWCIKEQGLELGDVRIYADPSRPDSIDYLVRRGVRVFSANNKYDQGIARVQAFVHRGMPFVAPHLFNLLRECDTWAYREGTDDPIKVGDDACDALRYACMAMADMPKGANVQGIKQVKLTSMDYDDY